MFKVTKDTTLGELLSTFPELGEVLTQMGMHCLGCPSSRGETLEQAAEVHDMEVDDLVEDIRGFLEG